MASLGNLIQISVKKEQLLAPVIKGRVEMGGWDQTVGGLGLSPLVPAGSQQDPWYMVTFSPLVSLTWLQIWKLLGSYQGVPASAGCGRELETLGWGSAASRVSRVPCLPRIWQWG